MAKVNAHTEYNAMFNSIINWMDDNGLTVMGNGGVRTLVDRYCAGHKVSKAKRKKVLSIMRTIADEEFGE